MKANRGPTLLLAAVSVLAVACLQGCGNEYPEPLYPSSISGHVSYSGSALTSTAELGLAVMAFGVPLDEIEELPVPHAYRFIVDPVFFDGRVAFELRHVQPHTYTVVAVLTDLDSDPLASGFRPSVEVGEAQAITEVDITLIEGAVL